MKITVGQGTHVTRRLSYGVVAAGILTKHIILAEDSEHCIILHYLNGASGDEVERHENISLVDQSISWRSVSSFELHGQSSQTPGRGSLECWTIIEQISVQMNTDISLETVGEALEIFQD